MAKQKKPMTETELRAAAEAAIRECVGFSSSEIVSEREEALKRYYGEEYGDEIAGRSSVVSRDTLETVEWMLPSLLRIFASGDVVKYEPSGPEDEAVAEQATDYAQFIFNADNNGFLVFHDWFKDALLQKVGVVKHWWEKTEKKVVESYAGLTDEEVLKLVDDDVEVLEHTEVEIEEELGVTLHDIKIQRTMDDGRVRIECVPPEEFLISSRSKTIKDAIFVGHRVRKTRSELIEMGFDRTKVEALGDEGDTDFQTGERETRMADEEFNQGANATDDSTAYVTYTEGYMRCDLNRDGLAELVKVSLGGVGQVELLAHEEVDRVPFSDLCPIRTPHKFFGLSIADLVDDIARIKTALMRGMLDNLYLTNNPEREVDTNQIVNMDDFLTSRPGGIKRVKAIGASREIVVPFTAAASMPMVEMLDNIKQMRTGSAPATQVDAEALQNQSATAATYAHDASAQRVELIARIFAETGVKDLFRNILKIITSHQDKERVIRLRNQWVPMDPRSWNAEMDVSINVGLGHGNKQGQAAMLNQILQYQIMGLQQGGIGMVTPKHVYNTLEKLVNVAGFRNVDPFFADPGDGQMQQGQQQDPAEAQAMLDAQVEQKKAEIKAGVEYQTKTAQMQLDAELKREQMQMEMQLKREQMLMEAQLQHERSMGGMASPVRMGGAIG